MLRYQWRAGVADPPSVGYRITDSRIAADRVGGAIWISAQRSQTGVHIGRADHRERTGMMLAIERCHLERHAVAGGIFRVVEPEPHLERVRRVQAHVGVEAEDLIQQDGLDAYMAVVSVFTDLDIGLIPGQPEVIRDEGGVRRPV